MRVRTRYKDPLALTREQRRVGLAGVARARLALDQAKKRAAVDYSETFKREESTDDDCGYRKR